MPRIRLTTRLPVLPVPEHGRTLFWDDSPSSPAWFGVRVNHSGARSFVLGFRIGGRERLLSLGSVETLSLADARAMARAALSQVAAGTDPLAEKAAQKRPTETVADLARSWLISREAGLWRPRTAAEFERIVARHVDGSAFGALFPSKVSRADIRRLLDGIESDSVSDHTRSVLRLLFAWASEHDRIGALPLFPAKRNPYAPRERVLDEDEIKRWWAACEAAPGSTKVAFKLMLLTAQRRGEILSMAWSDVTEERDGAWLTIRAENTKAGREHRVPLTGSALSLLGTLGRGSEYVFPSPRSNSEAPHITNVQKAASLLWKAAVVEGATLHDLRRTGASLMAASGVSDVDVARVLGHAMVREAPRVTEVYLRDLRRHDAPKRMALEALERKLATILAGQETAANVVPFAREP
jgi:integrase